MGSVSFCLQRGRNTSITFTEGQLFSLRNKVHILPPAGCHNICTINLLKKLLTIKDGWILENPISLHDERKHMGGGIRACVAPYFKDCHTVSFTQHRLRATTYWTFLGLDHTMFCVSFRPRRKPLTAPNAAPGKQKWCHSENDSQWLGDPPITRVQPGWWFLGRSLWSRLYITYAARKICIIPD